MTYAIVTAILVLALIAVVVAVVFETDDDRVEAETGKAVPPRPVPYAGSVTAPPRDVAYVEDEEIQDHERRVVDVPEDTDRDSRSLGI